MIIITVIPMYVFVSIELTQGQPTSAAYGKVSATYTAGDSDNVQYYLINMYMQIMGWIAYPAHCWFI